MPTLALPASGPLDAEDGLSLHLEWQPAPTAPFRGGALIVHGYADHGGRYTEVARHLAGLGFATAAVDYRGHGRAGGRRGHCLKFAEYLGDLDRALQAVRRAIPADAPILLVAHSHGGLIALRALTEPGRPLHGVTAAVLSSPFLGIGMKVNPVKIVAAKVLSRLVPALTMPNGIDVNLLTHDPEVLARANEDTLRHTVATARWFTEARAAQQYVARCAARITLPTLWLIGADDRIASVAAMRDVYGRAGGEKEVHVYDGLFHEVLFEKDRARVMRDVDGWITARFPPR